MPLQTGADLVEDRIVVRVGRNGGQDLGLRPGGVLTYVHDPQRGSAPTGGVEGPLQGAQAVVRTVDRRDDRLGVHVSSPPVYGLRLPGPVWPR
ncbi:hypothetical protein SGRIM128S_07032 [Streptomyces griseomycini]